MALAQRLAETFVIGLLTPLTAVCVLPLYPGFISYMASSLDDGASRLGFLELGVLVLVGVMAFMMSIGLVFSAFLSQSLTGVVNTVSPVAFAILGLISIGMLLDFKLPGNLPTVNIPRPEDPRKGALGFGFFFGAIVIPCNPALIAFFFARSFLFETPASSLLNFGAYGLGIGMPLLLLAAVSSARARQVTEILTEHGTTIHRASGALMLAVSVYYLLFVFEVVPWI